MSTFLTVLGFIAWLMLGGWGFYRGTQASEFEGGEVVAFFVMSIILAPFVAGYEIARGNKKDARP